MSGVASDEPASRAVNDRTRPARHHAPPGRAAQAARDVDFPLAIRGYDRGAVDRYVEEVNQAIAELEISSSPQSAVRHALEQVSEETSGLLQQAHETADELTERSRAQADDRLQRAQREADEVREVARREADDIRAAVRREIEEMRAEAQARADELALSAERIAKDRRRLIDEVRDVAARVTKLAEDEAARFAERPNAGSDRPTDQLEPQPESD